MRTSRFLKSTINVNGAPKLLMLGEWAIEKLSAEKYLEFCADQEIINNYLEPYYASGSLIEVPVLEDLTTATGTIKHIIGVDYVQNTPIDDPPQFRKWMLEMKNHPDTITFRDTQYI